MARPIADTPVLTGKDARRFREAMENVKPVSQEKRQQMEEAFQLFKKMDVHGIWRSHYKD
ncbi:MAG: hypothetical protein LBS94_01625 [Prevotellaceae bacterium]|jgi:hypothetical protein|nr:hypothetical protein [Prevotellaceae bacterium]